MTTLIGWGLSLQKKLSRIGYQEVSVPALDRSTLHFSLSNFEGNTPSARAPRFFLLRAAIAGWCDVGLGKLHGPQACHVFASGTETAMVESRMHFLLLQT